jgi:hypothetical protein
MTGCFGSTYYLKAVLILNGDSPVVQRIGLSSFLNTLVPQKQDLEGKEEWEKIYVK